MGKGIKKKTKRKIKQVRKRSLAFAIAFAMTLTTASPEMSLAAAKADGLTADETEMENPASIEHEPDDVMKDDRESDGHESDEVKADDKESDGHESDETKSDDGESDEYEADRAKTDDAEPARHEMDEIKADTPQADEQKTDEAEPDGFGIDVHEGGQDAEEEPYVVSRNRPAYASSQNGGDTADKAFDGDPKTRWQALDKDKNEWIYVDLGKVTQITSVYVSWEDAAAKTYTVQFSDDEADWTDELTVTDGKGREERMLDVKGEARYVRILCTERTMTYGSSLYEFQVYGLDGLTKRPVDYGENLALNKSVTASSIQLEWWMFVGANEENRQQVIEELFKNGYPVDADGKLLKQEDAVNWILEDEHLFYAPGKLVLDQRSRLPRNVVDGVVDDKYWHAATPNANKREDDQWVCVDLEEEREIGRIILDWENPARAYQIQVSNDAENWTTIYSRMADYVKTKNLQVYAKGRYVRLYCLAGWDFNQGVGLKEMQIFGYSEDDPKPSYDTEEIPQIQTVSVPGSKATYAKDDVRFPMAKPPAYMDEELQNEPVASNDWWQTIAITALGNGLVALPYRTKYSTSGLSVIEVNDCWYADESKKGGLGSAVVNSKTDFYLTPEGMDVSEIYDRVVAYSDYSVTAQLCDADGPVMTNTIVKGGPYIFSEFGDTQDVVIYSSNITGIYDDNGNGLLTENNKEITADHFGIEITDDDNKAKENAKSYFAINLPEGTTVRRLDSKIKIHFAQKNGYMSIGAMTKRTDLKTFYQHGYAFVTDTSVTYKFDEDTSKITTYYKVTTELKRTGFSADTMQCLFPHQYKKLRNATVSDELKYVSSRGTMKTLTGNTFETQDTFYGMVPQFTTPQNEEYDDKLIKTYLAQVEKQTRDEKATGDAYWEGKAFHPLALATLVADQSGNTEYQELFLERLRYLFDDWLTYTGEDDDAYFYYDSNWGTLYYRFSEFGANWGICDHHFTYGYFLFAAAVLATYDDAFYDEYKEMMDLIVRDYASPYEDDDLFCRFRSYDLYEGHSWAGGYADNDSGNNQEAGGESLFGWVGMYLWSIRSGNKDFRDAAIFGFTTELNDVEQYWFNYDRDNWPEDYPHYIVGQNYGATIFMGTFFDGNMTSVYGIHWLPVAEWITHYSIGDKKTKLQEMYEGFLDEIEGQKQIESAQGHSPDIVKTPLTAWQHIFVPLRSQYDPDGALEDYWKVVNGEVKNADGNVATFDNNEQFNAYWFANNMKDLGNKTNEIYALDGWSASVYKNDKGDYNAIVWNPTEEDVQVRFTDGKNIVGSVVVGSQSLVRLDPLEKDMIQVSAPRFSLVSGSYEDTQYLKISSTVEGAKVYYTTDGSSPTAKSQEYSGPIAITNTTTVKAVAIKDGSIDSKVSFVTIRIESGSVTTGKNIAAGKRVTATSERSPAANIVDGSAKTRWESNHTDDESCTIDLGDIYTVNKVKISWETAYASQYKIQVSTDNANWTDVYVENAGNGGFDELVFEAAKARYVRMQGVKRAGNFGYSIYEMGVYEARKITAPQFSIAEGTYGKGQKLSIGSGTPAVEIRYTLDGTEPTKNSLLYVGTITLDKNAAIKAKAFKLGMLDSDTAGVSITITENGQIKDESGWAPKPDKTIEEELLDGEAGETIDDPLLKTCLSYKKKVTVSSSENENTAGNVTDGSFDKGWSSAFAENGQNFTDEKRFDQWCYIDLGKSVKFNEVKIKWITNNNKYKIQVSDDAEDWTDVCTHTQKTTENKIDICRFDEVTARYVKMQGISVGEGWGYSLAEMMVYDSKDEQPLGMNVAAGVKVDVSSNTADADNVCDGDTKTVWKPQGEGKPSVTLDMFKTYQIDKVILNGTYNGEVTIQVSADGKTWTSIANQSGADGVYKFDKIDAKYVKVEFEDAENLSLSELEVYTTGSADVVDVQVTYYDRKGAGASSKSENAGKIINGIANNDNMWQADKEDVNAWCYIDLGESKDVNIVSVNFEASYAENYDIYLTNNITNWQPKDSELAYKGENGKAGEVVTVLTNPGKARYVIIRQTKTSGTSAAYGCAVYELNAGYRAPIAVERVSVGPSEKTIAIGDSLTAVCVVSPSNADNTNVIWSSSDEDVATVTDKGVIKGKGAGTAVITAVAEADKTKSGTVKVSVAGPISIPRPKAEKTGDNEIKISWTPNAHAIGYKIYRSRIQDKTQNGTLNGSDTLLNDELLTDTEYIDTEVPKGTHYYKIEAVAADNDPIYKTNRSAQSFGVQITNLLDDIYLTPSSLAMKKGEGKALVVTASPASFLDDNEVTWSVRNGSIAEISVTGTKHENCTVKGKEAGTTTVTVTVGSRTKNCLITVTDKLAAPTGLTAQTADSAVTLTWDKVESATSYDVYRAVSKDGEYEKLNNVKKAAYTDNLTKSGTYYYKVVAKGSSVWLPSDASNIVNATVTVEGSDDGDEDDDDTKTNKLAAPKNLTAQTAGSAVTLTWDEVDNAESYDVYRAVSKDGEYEKLNNVKKAAYTDNLTKSGTYYYKIVAKGSGTWLPSDASSIVNATVTVEGGGSSGSDDGDDDDDDDDDNKLDAPENLTAQTEGSTVTLTWDEVENAESYDVYRAVSEDGEYEWISTVEEAAYTDNLTEPGTYYYYVVAIGSGTWQSSDASDIVNATVKVVGSADDGGTKKNKLAAPANLTARVTKGAVTLTWNKVENAVSYDVYRAAAANGAYGKIANVKKMTYTDNVTKSGTYYYKVVAIGSGVWKTSDASNIAKAVVPTVVSSVKAAVMSRPNGIKTVYLKKKAKMTLSAVVTTNGINKKVTYKSSNTAVASVNSKGQVKAGSKKGTAKITVTSVADPTKKATIKVKVVDKQKANTTLKLKSSKATLKAKGETTQIKIKKYTKTTTDSVSYKVTSGKKYVKVDKYGIVTSKVNRGKKAVKAKIRVTCGKKNAVLTVTIPKK